MVIHKNMTYPILQQAYGLLYSLEMLHLEKFALTAMTFKVTSGVFMISARRGKAPYASSGYYTTPTPSGCGVVQGAGPLPEKNQF